MRAIRLIALATAAGLALCGAAAAATPSIVVAIDQSARLDVPGSAASVLVGSPSVADVTVIDSRTLYVSGRGYGSTDVVVLDQWGAPLYRGSIVVTAPDIGRVSIYRGVDRTDLACAPNCQVSTRSGGQGGGAAARVQPVSPAGAVVSALTGAVGP